MAYAHLYNGTLTSAHVRLKQMHKSLVRPVIEYASTVWSPHTKKNITKVESAQRKSARWVMSDWHCTSSVTAMLESLEWPEPSSGPCHQIINNLVDIDTNQYLEPAVVRGEEAVRFIIPYARTSEYKDSFFKVAVRLWYNTPAPSPMTFVSLSNLRLSLATIQLD